MARDPSKTYLKGVLILLSLILFASGGAIFYTQLSTYVTPLMLLAAGGIILFHLVIKLGIDTFREVGLPQAIFGGIGIITLIAGFLSFTQIGKTFLPIIGSIGLIVAAITLIAEAVTM